MKNFLLLFTVGILLGYNALGQGNIGIGTGNPQLRLDVAGAIGSTPGSAAAANSVVIPNNLSIFRLTAVGGTQTNSLSLASPQNGQYLTIINEDNDAATFAGTTIPAGASADFIFVGASATWKQTATSALSGGNGITISNNVVNSVWTQTGNDIYNNTSGNVGIGTGGAAGQKLQVDNGNMLVRGAGNFTGDAIYYMGDVNHFIKSTAGDGVTIGTFGINPGIKLKQSTGRVGIGVAAPNQRLEIGGNGGLGFSGTSPSLNSADKKLYSPTDGELEWMTHNSAGAHAFSVSHQGTKLVYLNTAGNSYLNGGNVGIGDNNPAQKLVVQLGTGITESNKFRLSGAASTDYLSAFVSAAGSGELRLVGWGSGWNMTQMTANKHLYINRDAPSTSNLYLGTINNELTVAGSSGFVGVKTTAPIQELHVNGRMNVTNGVIQRGTTQITATADLGLYSQVSGNWIRIASNAAPIKFFVDQGGGNSAGGTDAFAIGNDGRLHYTFGESSGTQLLPDAFCVVIPRSVGCPGNWDTREVKWDTMDAANADGGKDGRIAWDDGNLSSIRMRFCCRGSGW